LAIAATFVPAGTPPAPPPGNPAALLVTGPGPGIGPHVRAFGFGAAGMVEVANFFAYNPAFQGGVYVAVGDVTGAGHADIVTGAGPGGGPHVRVFTGAGADTGIGFMAYSPGFTGGVRVAACDVDGDGHAEIVTAAGPGGGPHVRVWRVVNGSVVEVRGFFAYSPAFTGGLFVACGDVGGSRRAALHTRPGPRGGPP